MPGIPHLIQYIHPHINSSSAVSLLSSNIFPSLSSLLSLPSMLPFFNSPFTFWNNRMQVDDMQAQAVKERSGSPGLPENALQPDKTSTNAGREKASEKENVERTPFLPQGYSAQAGGRVGTPLRDCIYHIFWAQKTSLHKPVIGTPQQCYKEWRVCFDQTLQKKTPGLPSSRIQWRHYQKK